MKDYCPLVIWLQPVNDFGVDVGEPQQSCNDALIHMQVGEKLTNPRIVSDVNADEFIEGEWTVQERVFSEGKTQIVAHLQIVSRALTIYLQKR